MRRIFLVDDEYAIVEVLSILLGEAGYAVSAAPDGLDALQKILAEPPDAVITDQLMPVMGGRELFSALRENPGTREIPVILMSSATPPRELERLPWAMLLHKPFDLDVLLGWLRAHLPAQGA